MEIWDTWIKDGYEYVVTPLGDWRGLHEVVPAGDDWRFVHHSERERWALSPHAMLTDAWRKLVVMSWLAGVW
jgi:hypothetical protein